MRLLTNIVLCAIISIRVSVGPLKSHTLEASMYSYIFVIYVYDQENLNGTGNLEETNLNTRREKYFGKSHTSQIMPQIGWNIFEIVLGECNHEYTVKEIAFDVKANEVSVFLGDIPLETEKYDEFTSTIVDDGWIEREYI